MGGNEAEWLMEISDIPLWDLALGMTGIVSKAVSQSIPASQQLPNPLSWDLSGIPCGWHREQTQNNPELPGLHQPCCRCVIHPAPCLKAHPAFPRKWHKISTPIHRSGNSGCVEIHPALLPRNSNCAAPLARNPSWGENPALGSFLNEERKDKKITFSILGNKKGGVCKYPSWEQPC